MSLLNFVIIYLLFDDEKIRGKSGIPARIMVAGLGGEILPTDSFADKRTKADAPPR
jgi:hypothetical protein